MENTNGLIVAKDNTVALVYELREGAADGQVVERVNENEPLTFVYGVGRMIPGFEANIKGLKVGDDFAFLIQPDEAYGMPDDERIVQVPTEAFIVDGKLQTEILQVNKMIMLSDDSGQQYAGIIKKVDDKGAVVDFNHPMAGKTLHFEGKITNILPPENNTTV